jgi:hypothetical protein
MLKQRLNKKNSKYIFLALVPVLLFHALETMGEINSAASEIKGILIPANETNIKIENNINMCLICDKSPSPKNHLSYIAIELSIVLFGISINLHFRNDEKGTNKETKDKTDAGPDSLLQEIDSLKNEIEEMYRRVETAEENIKKMIRDNGEPATSRKIE